jgi:hypothetical protein
MGAEAQTPTSPRRSCPLILCVADPALVLEPLGTWRACRRDRGAARTSRPDPAFCAPARRRRRSRAGPRRAGRGGLASPASRRRASGVALLTAAVERDRARRFEPLVAGAPECECRRVPGAARWARPGHAFCASARRRRRSWAEPRHVGGRPSRGAPASRRASCFARAGRVARFRYNVGP